jgi:uncharacterized protein (DUF2236 family)
MMRAGIDLLPPWAQEMLNLPMSAVQRHCTRRRPRTARVGAYGAYHCAMRRMNQF